MEISPLAGKPADWDAIGERYGLNLGLTSNPTIFDHAITHSKSYDSAIQRLLRSGISGEALFFELALQDLTRAADLFAPIHERTAGVDGWVSLEVSPLLAYDATATVPEPRALHKAERRKPVIKIPGTKEGAPAIEETIFAGVPVVRAARTQIATQF